MLPHDFDFSVVLELHFAYTRASFHSQSATIPDKIVERIFKLMFLSKTRISVEKKNYLILSSQSSINLLLVLVPSTPTLPRKGWREGGSISHILLCDNVS